MAVEPALFALNSRNAFNFIVLKIGSDGWIKATEVKGKMGDAARMVDVDISFDPDRDQKLIGADSNTRLIIRYRAKLPNPVRPPTVPVITGVISITLANATGMSTPAPVEVAVTYDDFS
jgi:hypothetical protein